MNISFVLLGLCVYEFLKINNRIGNNPKMFEMSKIESFDIDDMDDFKLAEALQKNLNK